MRDLKNKKINCYYF